MNLNQYLTANQTATLATTQAYSETVDTKKVGSGQARGYLVATNDLWKTIKLIQADITHPLFSIADALITTASDANSYFGMDITKADGVANIGAIATLVSASVMTQADANGFIAKTLTVTTPFATTTQAQYDAVKAEIALTGTQLQTNTSYQGDTTVGYIIKLKSDELIIDVIHDLPVTVNTSITLWAENLDAVSGLYIRETNPIRTLQFEPTAQAKSIRSRTNYGARKTRIVGISNRLQTFNITVTVA